ncbi:MAG: DUF418 domain-containing protein [Allosphingosinicella sp.]|uniref:DUF418 domain-containing protein n=1 Tax=Allosphingosinicella sp. TaxID=2823234 RepID=UPI00394D71C7
MATAAVPAEAAVAPAAKAEVKAGPGGVRIEALDFVRGAALFGILLMNITGFGLPEAYENPQNSGGAEGVNLWAWMITQIGFEGTQRGLFSLLFGASVILLTARLEASGRPDAADIYFRRNLWLIGFGLVNAYVFLWFGDILYAYGVTALFVFAFRNMAPRRLLAIGVGTLLLLSAWNAWDASKGLAAHRAFAEAQAAQARGAELSPEQEKAVESWKGIEAYFVAPPDRIAEEIEARTNGYGRAFLATAPINVKMQTWFTYRYFFDVFGMMLIGMALYRWGVLTLERPTWLYVAMALGGYAIGLAVNILETRWILANGFSALAFAQTAVTYELGRLPMTIGHLGALLLFVRSGLLGRFRRALAAVGQMAVTNYLTHSVVCAIIFVGFGLYGQLERHQLYYVVFAIWAVQLVASPIWLRHFRFGPVEWLWRYLTYLKRPPIRHTAVPTSAGAAAAA